jgi:hypothetical protein
MAQLWLAAWHESDMVIRKNNSDIIKLPFKKFYLQKCRFELENQAVIQVDRLPSDLKSWFNKQHRHSTALEYGTGLTAEKSHLPNLKASQTNHPFAISN